MGNFNKYPYINFSDLNLDWVLEQVKKITSDYETLSKWREDHEAEYEELKREVAGLIQNMTRPVEPWDGTKAYTRYTLVSYNGDTYIAIQDVPAGVLITNTDYWEEAQTIETELNAIKADLLAVEEATEGAVDTLDLMNSDIITIKGADETIDGFPYGGFCGGCVFRGRELYAFRAAPAHKTTAGDFGEIAFYERKNGNIFEKLDITPIYDSAVYGELRDPNLSVSRDGTRLYLTCFTSFTADGTTHNSVLFAFNEDYLQIGFSAVTDSIFWGNTLETPSGYLLHASYEDNTITLYKSTQAITNSNVGSISWTSSEPFTLTSGRLYAEPTIGYFNNRLVMITRTNGTYASEIAYTFDLEGNSGWVQNASIGRNLHAPALLPYCTGDLLPCSGSVVDADITGDASYRMPYMMLLSFSNSRVNSSSCIAADAEGLIVPASEAPSLGGYTTLVKLHEDTYGIMYYGDTDDENIVAFTEIKLYKSLVNMTYHQMCGSQNEPIYYTTYGKAAYNKSIADWVIAALSDNSFNHICFASATSASDITDRPTGLQSNFAGYAYRVSTQYYVELFFFSSGTPVRAIKTGTSATLGTNTWTIT